MASDKKGNTWHLDMKMHVATDSVLWGITDVLDCTTKEYDIVRAHEVIPSETKDV